MAWAIPIVAALISAGGTYAANKWGNKAGENEQVSNFTPGQQSALDQALKGFQGGGGIESALRYFQDLLSDNPDAMKAFEAPAMRQFNEQIIPNIAERFSGQGAGGQGAAQSERARQERVRQVELRGDSHGAARKRAVRSREGRVYGRNFAADRTLRAGDQRHRISRRDRRNSTGTATETAPRFAGA